jgi:nucleoside-diphosphate-sugar epimerase
MSNINVIFGTGPLGKAVMKALLKRGKRVRMVNRSGSAGVPPEVEVVAGDASNRVFTRQVTSGAEVVFQCAQPAYHEWAEKFPSFQASILDGVAANGAKFIVAENLYMYGMVKGPIHEGLPYAATTRKGKVRAEMSAALLEAHRSGKVHAAIARGADFYGPEVLESSLGERAFGAAVRGKAASLVGRLDLPHTYTYIQDFGEAMAILSEREEALGQAWHVPNPPTLSQRELMTMFFEQIDRPARMSGMGRAMMSLGGLFIVGARETVEMMYEFENPFVVDSSRFTRAFGDLATPHTTAMKTTAAWYREWAELKPRA